MYLKAFVLKVICTSKHLYFKAGQYICMNVPLSVSLSELLWVRGVDFVLYTFPWKWECFVQCSHREVVLTWFIFNLFHRHTICRICCKNLYLNCVKWSTLSMFDLFFLTKKMKVECDFSELWHRDFQLIPDFWGSRLQQWQTLRCQTWTSRRRMRRWLTWTWIWPWHEMLKNLINLVNSCKIFYYRSIKYCSEMFLFGLVGVFVQIFRYFAVFVQTFAAYKLAVYTNVLL